MTDAFSTRLYRAARRRPNLIVAAGLFVFATGTYLNTIRRVGTGYDLEAELERELEQEARRQARLEKGR